MTEQELIKESRALLKGWFVNIFASPFIETPVDYWRSSLTLMTMFGYLAMDSQPEPWLAFGLMIIGVIYWIKGLTKK